MTSPTVADFHKLQRDVADAAAHIRKMEGSNAELRSLAEKAGADMRAMQEKLALSGRAPTGPESEISGRYGTKAVDGSPTLRMYRRENTDGGWEPRLLDDTLSLGEWHKAAKAAASDVSLVALIRCRSTHELRDPSMIGRLAPKSLRRLQSTLRYAPAGVRQRIFNSTDGTGGEFIPTEVRLPELITAAELAIEHSFSGLFDSDPMPNRTVISPLVTAGATPYLMGEASNDDPAQYRSSSLTSSERSRTAQKYGVRLVVDADADEDSIVAARATIIDLASKSIAIGRDDAVLNGDTGTHQDTGIASWNPRSMWDSSGLGSSVDHRRAWVGLRARAQDVSATLDLNSALTYANLLTLRGQLDPALGLDGDLVLALPFEDYVSSLLSLTQLATVDKYGASASVVTGEIARVAGMRVVTPHMMTSDLNASGVYDGVTTTQGQLLAFNRSRFRFGVRRGLMTEADKDITRGVHHLVASRREIFWTLDGASAKNVAQGYDL